MAGVVVTVNDYQRLTALIEFASLRTTMAQASLELYNKLKVAKMLSPEKIDKRIVTMNSKVLLRDRNSSREIEITITYPHDAEPRKQRVSVMSEIGRELLGRREGDEVSWRVPKGVGKFVIEKVTYQPEAAGHFFL